MKLVVVLTIVAVIFGNSAKATTPEDESANANSMTNGTTARLVPTANSTTNGTTPKPTTANSTTNGTTPKPTTANSTTNGTTPKPTTANSTTNGTTPKPTTANSTTNGTTPKPTTANSTTNGTTPKPTTANSTTNGTTPKPTPTANSTTNGTTTPKSTPAKPTTPTPPPPPPYGNFSLEENGTYCILAQFFAEFLITFEVKNSRGNTSEKTLNKTLGRGSNVVISGNCGSKLGSTLVISWPKNASLYVLTMEFMDTTGNWSLTSVTFNVTVYNNSEFANATVEGRFVASTYNGRQETSPHGQVGGNYLCEDATVFVFNSSEKSFKVKSTFKDFRVQPFANATEVNSFNKNVTEECAKDFETTTSPSKAPSPTNKPSDIIPIAVGCALAGLVLIVLIAYVIGRRKSHSGYQKV